MNSSPFENFEAAPAKSMGLNVDVKMAEDERTGFFQSCETILSTMNPKYPLILPLKVLSDTHQEVNDADSLSSYVRRKKVEGPADDKFLEAIKDYRSGKSSFDVVERLLEPSNVSVLSIKLQQLIGVLNDEDNIQISQDTVEDVLKERYAYKVHVDGIMEAWEKPGVSKTDALKTLNESYNLLNFWAKEPIWKVLTNLKEEIAKFSPRFDHWPISALPDTKSCRIFEEVALNKHLPDRFRVAGKTLNLRQLFTIVGSTGITNNCLCEAFSNALFRSQVRSIEMRIRSIVELFSTSGEYCSIWQCPKDCVTSKKCRVVMAALIAARRFNEVPFLFVHPLSRIARCNVYCWKLVATATGFRFVRDFEFTVVANYPQSGPPVQLLRYNASNPKGSKNHIACLLPIKGAKVPSEYWSSWNLANRDQEQEENNECSDPNREILQFNCE